MRKAITGLGSVLLFLNTTIQAQNVDFGVTAGFQFTSQYSYESGDFVPGFSGRTGLLFGGHASIFLYERLVVKPMLIFSRKGSWVDSNDKIDESDPNIYTITNDYLSLPILAKFYVVGGLHLQAGPQFSYLLSSNTKVGSTKVLSGNLKEQNIIKSLDAGLVIGLGYEFESTFTFSLNFDFSYTNQLKDADAFAQTLVDEFGNDIEFNDPFPSSAKNVAIQFIFSYNFTKNRSAF